MAFQYFVRSISKGQQETTPCGVKLSPTQAHILMSLLEYRYDDFSQSDLVKKLNLDKSNIARACDILEKNGFIIRDRSKEDKRSYLLQLTKKGEKLAIKINKSSQKYIKSILNEFSSNEQRIIIKAIKKMAATSGQTSKE